MFYKHPVSVSSHFELFSNLSYCPVFSHISDNLSPKLISGYPQKVENQSSHLTPSLMGLSTHPVYQLVVLILVV